MKYIKIKNQGEIEPQALHLVGASTKRNDSTKIGQFGSGNKYAIAFLLRNGYSLKVFAGLDEITIETRTETLRDMDFEVIYLNGEKTSITTEMGKDWQFWQAMRELYCNALDEGGYSMDFVQEIVPVEGETHFYIDTKKDVMEFVSNFDNYFAINKKVIFKCATGRIIEKTGDTVNLYRKGIRCFNSPKKSVYDYDFNDINIDENRLISYFWQTEEKIWDLIYQCDNEAVIMSILHHADDHEYIEGCISDVSTISAARMSETFKKLCVSNNFAPSGFAGLLKPDEVHNHIIVPTKVFKSMRGALKDDNVGDKFKVGKHGAIFRPVELSPLQDITLKKAIEFLNEVNYPIDFDIELSIFDDKKVLGMAYQENKTIFLSDICLEKGVNTVVVVLIEEHIHLKYDVKDETRGFQTAVLTDFVSYMKKQNAYAL